MEKSKDRENRFRGKGTRKHKAETQKLTPMDESTSRVVSPQKSLHNAGPQYPKFICWENEKNI